MAAPYDVALLQRFRVQRRRAPLIDTRRAQTAPPTLHHVLWSPDGAALLTAAADTTLAVYAVDALYPAPPGTPPRPPTPLASLRRPSPTLAAAWYPYASAQAPDSFCVATAARDLPVQIWRVPVDAYDAAGPRRPAERIAAFYPTERGEPRPSPQALAFTADGGSLLAGGRGGVTLADATRADGGGGGGGGGGSTCERWVPIVGGGRHTSRGVAIETAATVAHDTGRGGAASAAARVVGLRLGARTRGELRLRPHAQTRPATALETVSVLAAVPTAPALAVAGTRRGDVALLDLRIARAAIYLTTREVTQRTTRPASAAWRWQQRHGVQRGILALHADAETLLVAQRGRAGVAEWDWRMPATCTAFYAPRRAAPDRGSRAWSLTPDRRTLVWGGADGRLSFQPRRAGPADGEAAVKPRAQTILMDAAASQAADETGMGAVTGLALHPLWDMAAVVRAPRRGATRPCDATLFGEATRPRLRDVPAFPEHDHDDPDDPNDPNDPDDPHDPDDPNDPNDPNDPSCAGDASSDTSSSGSYTDAVQAAHRRQNPENSENRVESPCAAYRDHDANADGRAGILVCDTSSSSHVGATLDLVLFRHVS
ncbi:hypothetical protein CXG81DRAFT_17257 [Caulochytrium protostelioides]|uniref:WD40 repeat-like protein n=1 Tax=Caulochytrium protostelioides TaxID=1555241 RepID=A0A4P9XDE5_9FUNG|nr:hypothetical protein CXG81DRAFT_17257 [Caulochytrium protostelioides]|eukprot:RKP03200.1 hypothetical protein CXG81DRAFT_17257 [Caulochytrium protostelioides]